MKNFFFTLFFRKSCRILNNIFSLFELSAYQRRPCWARTYEIPYLHASPSAWRMRILRAPETVYFGYLIFGFLEKIVWRKLKKDPIMVVKWNLRLTAPEGSIQKKVISVLIYILSLEHNSRVCAFSIPLSVLNGSIQHRLSSNHIPFLINK